MISIDAGKEYKTMLLGLDRIKKFLSDQNIEYNKLKYIHIAGTNGKGSVAKTLSEILISSGYKTGLYTSPHLIKINERIQINSLPITDRQLKSLDKKYSDISKKYKLTYFEYITALAFIYFVKSKVDIVVLETGLGGRLDATNIVSPLVSVITSIDFDHTEVLGNTLQKIAFEKAGIIKDGVPVVCGNIKSSALSVIKKVARQKKSKIYIFNKNFGAKYKSCNWKNLTQKIDYSGINKNLTVEYSLLGNSQVYNSAMVLAVCEILKKDLKISFNTVNKVCKNIKWPARFDFRKVKINGKRSSFIIDGAHNIQAINNFFELYKKSPFYKKTTKLLFAVMQEKDFKTVIKKVAKNFNNVSLLKVENSRAVDINVLKKEFSKYIDNKNIYTYDTVKQFFGNIKNNDVYICLGSFYLAGTILKFTEETNG
ncbi:MAG: bifunctional folylpolyglutamate synthase/dihydrofolate synthase [Elusimicrobia bacterium]|nr:bifunctional folylpolyglutamate synthase/dihydrofolate synthase [Elusimicrobiota bacterium]